MSPFSTFKPIKCLGRAIACLLQQPYCNSDPNVTDLYQQAVMICVIQRSGSLFREVNSGPHEDPGLLGVEFGKQQSLLRNRRVNELKHMRSTSHC